MTLIDVSRPLSNTTPGWPGDTPFSYEVSWPMEKSGSVNVGKVTMSIHTGTHVDAPFHFDNDGQKITEIDLNLYVGIARVIDVSGRESIGVEDLVNVEFNGIERVLFKTSSWRDSNQFPSEIPFLREDLASFLKEKGVRLIGVDIPSVDPLDSKELLAHHSLSRAGIHILESLQLDHVYPGDYELIALPLAIEGADGSPVRAVLRELS